MEVKAYAIPEQGAPLQPWTFQVVQHSPKSEHNPTFLLVDLMSPLSSAWALEIGAAVRIMRAASSMIQGQVQNGPG